MNSACFISRIRACEAFKSRTHTYVLHVPGQPLTGAWSNISTWNIREKKSFSTKLIGGMPRSTSLGLASPPLLEPNGAALTVVLRCLLRALPCRREGLHSDQHCSAIRGHRQETNENSVVYFLLFRSRNFLDDIAQLVLAFIRYMRVHSNNPENIRVAFVRAVSRP